ncbi:DNA-binding PadR family transcriptional regulator [Acetoanaerobium pronyense]|uniref:DNA-binding PadR family transcriptional regulator n=1 Tax=Acetoanaerobium pronyense TaxID=1482736 RepID=A0ABS4KKH8_9FIRM|nr:helix-turn-helix transcriptional regulator [Acetoanaerobium pronyense]MBP2028287.1 DNA-binding PadR family transcriptional regulator [Acetoanaerobium pronyense]
MSDQERIILNTKQEMKRGTLVLAVLMLLDSPQYGYSLIEALNEKNINIEQNTLYPLLRRLEKQNILESIWQVENNRPRRYYKISEEGKTLRENLIKEWVELSLAMNALIGGKS